MAVLLPSTIAKPEKGRGQHAVFVSIPEKTLYMYKIVFQPELKYLTQTVNMSFN